MIRLRWMTLLGAMLIALPLAAADPALQIDMLEQSVQTLSAQHVLNRGASRSLSVKLSHASDALRQADAKRVVSQLHAFEREARGLVAAGTLSPKSGTALIDGALSTRLAVERLAFTVPPIVVDLQQPCTVGRPCEKTEFWVNPRAGKGGSGAETSPVATIGEALARARQQGVCGARLHLAPGVYEESLEVPFDLHLSGGGEGVVVTGSILNRGGWDLHLERMTLRGSPWPGAVIVDSPCDSRTEISRVSIEEASGTGVFHRGGSIRIGLSTIERTGAVPGTPASGTALRLTGGATAVLGLVGIEENRGGGILAEGEGTSVYAGGVLVARNQVSPFAEPLPEGTVPQAPAVEIRDGALLLMQFGVVRGNDLYGLLLRNGARAHVRYTVIEQTRSLPEGHPYAWYADANAAVHGSVIELASFTLSHSVAGMILNNSLGSGTRGEISHNAIGMGLFWSLPDPPDVSNLVRCMTDRTPFLHNERNIDSATLPLPPADPPGETPAPPAECMRVPFDCTWCGA